MFLSVFGMLWMVNDCDGLLYLCIFVCFCYGVEGSPGFPMLVNYSEGIRPVLHQGLIFQHLVSH